MIGEAAAAETSPCYSTLTCTEDAYIHMDKVTGRGSSMRH